MLLQYVTAVLCAIIHTPIATPPDTGEVGLLVVAHGASQEWNAQVNALVGQVNWTRGPIETAFLMGDEAASHGWRESVTRLIADGATSIVVVPLMVSSHGEHYRQVLYYSGNADRLPEGLSGHAHEVPYHPVPMGVTRALDDAPELAETIALRWLEGAAASGPLVLLGHGPSENDDAEAWLADFSSVARHLRNQGHGEEIRLALLRDDASPPVRTEAIRALRDTISTLASRSGDSVTVMTILVARGALTRIKIPTDLEGLPVHYIPSVLAPLPPIARWIERVAQAGVRTAGPSRE
jgi:sirohydrochlorin ferrochelatase